MSAFEVRNRGQQQGGRADEWKPMDGNAQRAASNGAYRPRPIRFLGIWECGGFRLKAYGISARSRTPDAGFLDVARQCVQNCLANVAGGHHGVGFVCIHEGTQTDCVSIDWWASRHDLHHRLFICPSGGNRLRPADAHELTACVWALYVMGFERQAWIANVLDCADGSNFKAYLSQTLNAVV